MINQGLPSKKIVIFGGGIAGLTVAHECAEAGLEIHVYEKENICGGKAQGYRNPEGFHVEHSLRVYTSSYFSLFDTMKRVPYKGKTIFDNLVPVEGLILKSVKKIIPEAFVPRLFSVSQLEKNLAGARSLRAWGIPWSEILYLFWELSTFVMKSQERLRKNVWPYSFEDYIQLHKRSPAFQLYLKTLVSIIVAAKPTASAPLILDLLARTIVFHSYRYGIKGVQSTINALNGPTNERFIDPWVDYLKSLGVKFYMNSALEDLEIENGKVREAVMADRSHVNADAYVLALNYKSVKKFIPNFDAFEQLHHEWSFGMQFYLNAIPAMDIKNSCFNLVLDSPWDVVYLLEAPPLWKDVALHPSTKAILSVTLSNIENVGIVYHKPFHECTREEVYEEVLAQTGFDKCKDLIIQSSLDPRMLYLTKEEWEEQKNKYENSEWEICPSTKGGHRWVFNSPLYIAQPGTHDQMPTVKTSIDHLFLAGEYIKTPYLIPTMEKANESGKLCAKELCDYFGRTYNDSRLIPPELPMATIRKIDTLLFRLFR